MSKRHPPRANRGRRTALLAALLGLTAAFAAAQASSVQPKPEPRDRDVVRVATSGNHSERIEKLPITKRRGAENRVVMSLGPNKLPRLRRGDRLRTSAEVQFTLNCNEPMPRCIGPIYLYDPEVSIKLVLAKSAGSTQGMRLGAPERAVCRQRRPREHHCVLVVQDGGLRLDAPRKLPCQLNRCFVNLVASAYSPKAGKRDILIVGGNKPDGRIPQDRGRVNAVVFHPAKGSYPRPRRSRARVRNELPLDLKRRVVYSQRLTRLEAGEQLEVEAEVVTKRAGLPYSVRTSSQLILAGDRREVRPGPFARRLGGRGEIGESNGFNCTRNERTCTTRKVGVLRIAKNARLRGRFRPVFVNLVMIVGPKRFAAAPDDRYRVLRRGGLSVTRYGKPKR